VGRIWAAHKRGLVRYQEGCGSLWLCVEHSPWEASSYWVSQIRRILCNPMAHYRVHSILKIGSVHSRSFHPNPLTRILILSYPLRLCRPSDVLPSNFATRPCKYVSSSRASYMFNPSHSSLTTVLTCKSRTKLFMTHSSPFSCHSFVPSPKHIPQLAVLHHPQPM
jgi:hypothetical protein